RSARGVPATETVYLRALLPVTALDVSAPAPTLRHVALVFDDGEPAAIAQGATELAPLLARGLRCPSAHEPVPGLHAGARSPGLRLMPLPAIAASNGTELSHGHPRERAWALVLAGGDGTRLQALTRKIAGAPIPKQY